MYQTITSNENIVCYSILQYTIIKYYYTYYYIIVHISDRIFGSHWNSKLKDVRKISNTN